MEPDAGVPLTIPHGKHTFMAKKEQNMKNRIKIPDLAAALICMTAFGIACAYPDMVRHTTPVLWAAGLMAMALAALSLTAPQKKGKKLSYQEEPSPKTDLITELVLLNEEDGDLAVWDMYGRTSALIGRDVKENEVDIDLGQGPYAGMADTEHAVLNFSAGSWYVEDLGSANGLRLKKAADGRMYHLSPDMPCRLEKGDCLYVGMNRLLLR